MTERHRGVRERLDDLISRKAKVKDLKEEDFSDPAGLAAALDVRIQIVSAGLPEEYTDEADRRARELKWLLDNPSYAALITDPDLDKASGPHRDVLLGSGEVSASKFEVAHPAEPQRRAASARQGEDPEVANWRKQNEGRGNKPASYPPFLGGGTDSFAPQDRPTKVKIAREFRDSVPEKAEPTIEQQTVTDRFGNWLKAHKNKQGAHPKRGRAPIVNDPVATVGDEMAYWPDTVQGLGHRIYPDADTIHRDNLKGRVTESLERIEKEIPSFGIRVTKTPDVKALSRKKPMIYGFESIEDSPPITEETPLAPLDETQSTLLSRQTKESSTYVSRRRPYRPYIPHFTLEDGTTLPIETDPREAATFNKDVKDRRTKQ